MEAKDTVMTKDQMEEVKYLEIRDNPEYHDLRLLEKRDVEDKVIATKQAEISFKAGQEAGRKEVVEWIESHGGSLDGYRSEWQAKLKEWGL